jgi:hypothetical protein
MGLALDDGLEDAHDGLCSDTHVEEIERGWMDGWIDGWMDGLIDWGKATPLDTQHSKVFH